MFVDLYAIPASVPGYHKAQQKQHTADKIEVLQQAIQEDIQDTRFIPYVQRHEFESLLFAAETGFRKYYGEDSVIMSKLKEIFEQFNNPEDINDGSATAPSKRIIRIIPEYEKVVYGNILALEVGLATMMRKCPLFRQWIENLSCAVK